MPSNKNFSTQAVGKRTQGAITPFFVPEESIDFPMLAPGLSQRVGSRIFQSALANNQSSPANIDNFFIDPTSLASFEASYCINRIHAGVNISVSEDVAFYTTLTIPGDNSGFNGSVLAIGVQTDTKVVLGGAFTDLNAAARHFLVRLNADGSEDGTFYTTLTSVGDNSGFNSQVAAIAVQTDGKIVVAGSFTDFNGVAKSRLLRLNTDGTEDTVFYTNLTTPGDNSGLDSSVATVTVQPDGKILVGGDFANLNGSPRSFLLRLNTDGTEDTAFYTNLTTPGDNSGFNNGINRVVLQPADNKILVAGEFTDLNGSSRGCFVRLNTDGSEDTAFYTNLSTPGNNAGFVGALFVSSVQSNGKILVGGNFTTLNGITRHYLVRLNTDGTEDTAFYTTLTSVGDNSGFGFYVADLNIETSGSILAVGGFTTLNGVTKHGILKLNSDGTEDTSFYAALGSGVTSGSPSRIAVQANTQILISGAFSVFNGLTRHDIFRLNDSSISAPTERVSRGRVSGIYRPSVPEWELGDADSQADVTGVVFSVLPSGQVQYKTDNIPGTIIQSFIQFYYNGL